MNPQRFKDTDLRSLAADVVARVGPPVDYLQVAAALEVMGYTDQVISDRFGFPDSFSLARRLFHLCYLEVKATAIGKDRRRQGANWSLILGCGLRGTLLLFPMSLSLLILAIIGSSLWGEFELRQEVANSLALALAISMIISGGFGRLLTARLGSMISTGGGAGMTNIAACLTFFSFITTLAVTAMVLLLSESSFEPFALMTGAGSLSLVWMGLFILYVLRREWAFAPLLVTIVAAVLLARQFFPLSFLTWQQLGTMALAITLVSAGFILVYRYQVAAAKQTKVNTTKGPWWMQLHPSQFAFGLIYFSMLFVDRISNWMAEGVFAFKPAYETSLNLAMFSLLFGASVLEYRMERFWQSIFPSRRKSDQPVALKIKAFLTRSLVFYMIAAVAGVLISLTLAAKVRANQDLTVVLVAAPAYAILAWGSFVCSLYLGFKRWWEVLLVGTVALIVDIIVSFNASQSDPRLSVAGLLTGSLIFFVLGTLLLVRLVRKYPYFRYVTS